MALEEGLALLQPPLRRERFVAVLQGFLAFHRVWEPKVAVLVGDPAVTAPRGRTRLIEQDLQALGEGASAVRRAFDLGFLADRSAAWGSLYVMEGSTLGGQVISKALRSAAWAPGDGLTYFNPYGRRTAAMWASFREALDSASADLDAEAAARGARLTFQALQAGLTRSMGLAA